MGLHIAVAGNIGAGKTTLVTKLSRHYGWDAQFEAVDDNPYLADFYDDMSQWAFPLQIYFLHSRFNQVREIRKNDRDIIQDRTIYEDAHIFARNLFENEYLSERDFNNYFELYRSMTSLISPPDLLIYLKASISTLIEQIGRRGREYEANINIKYLETLNQHYNKWIDGYDDGKLIVVNVDDLNIVDIPEDLGKVIKRIDAELHGLFS